MNNEPVSSTYYDDRHPYIFKDGSKLYFDSNRPGSAGNYDIWEANLIRGKWVGAKPLPSPNINTSAYDAAPCVWESPGQMELYFESDRVGKSQLFYSEWDPLAEQWKPVKLMCLDFVSSLHPSINSTHGEMYFHTSGGIGNYDIFITICKPTPSPTGIWYSPTPTPTGTIPPVTPVSRLNTLILVFVLMFIVIGWSCEFDVSFFCQNRRSH